MILGHVVRADAVAGFEQELIAVSEADQGQGRLADLGGELHNFIERWFSLRVEADQVVQQIGRRHPGRRRI